MHSCLAPAWASSTDGPGGHDGSTGWPDASQRSCWGPSYLHPTIWQNNGLLGSFLKVAGSCFMYLGGLDVDHARLQGVPLAQASSSVAEAEGLALPPHGPLGLAD